MGLGQEIIQALMRRDNTNIDELLKRMNIECVNEANACGTTPLHAACRVNNVEAVSKLLSMPGINVNVKEISGLTPIMLASASCNNEVLRLMLDHPRVDLDVSTNDGRGIKEFAGTWAFEDERESECLKMIKEAVREREKEKRLEEMRANVRQKYIEKISQVNLEIEENQKELHDKMKCRNLKLTLLKRKQDMEKESMAKEKLKIELEKYELEKQLTRLQHNLNEVQQTSEDMVKRHDHEKKKLQNDFQEETEEVSYHISDLKEIVIQLEKEIRKQDESSPNLKAATETLECPVCLEIMKPPMQIFMCPLSHLVCGSCKCRLEGGLCPTCRSQTVTLRAFMAEKFARTLLTNRN